MDKINEGITYIFGEAAAIDGELNANWVVDFFYYKNSPLWDDIFSRIRDAVWSILTPIIAFFSTL